MSIASNPYTITELDFAYWIKKSSSTGISYNFVFAPGRSVKGMYREKSALSVVNGAVVPILQITTSDDALFDSCAESPSCSSCRRLPLYVLDSNGVKGAASTLQPVAAGVIQATA